MTLAVVPDRKLALLGTYVRFKKKFSYKRRRVAASGAAGVIVRDAMGLCVEGQVAVKVFGYKCRKGYVPVPWKILDVQRAAP